ncbi:MAG: hypothetical protein ABSG59_10990 [Verrucomicrobiota bacterium]|jgi:hypothetical protein
MKTAPLAARPRKASAKCRGRNSNGKALVLPERREGSREVTTAGELAAALRKRVNE